MPRILIIALSARPFATAAKQAGYQVTVIDGFGDAQTKACADEAFIVGFDETGFIADDLLDVINRLDTAQYQGFVYGSGFDGKPALLQEVANHLPLIGNSAAVLKAVRHKKTFFGALQKLHIRHPQIVDFVPTQQHVYLKKSMAGCGGTHIRFASQADVLNCCEYFQQYIDGRSISLLFLARTDAIEAIGFNEQWVGASESAPFCYGGAVGQVSLPVEVQQQLVEAAQALAVEWGLKGLNSLDAVVVDDSVYVLEINPRLSATFDLYDGISLFERHISAVYGLSGEINVTYDSNCDPICDSKAHAIAYAQKYTVIPADFAWPEWATDTPVIIDKSITVDAGQPICTAIAGGKNSDTAKQLVLDRVRMLQNQFTPSV